MVDLKGCRGCLNQNCKLERINDATRRVYCTITGLQCTPGDCYPNYFCSDCITQIKKIIAFRRRCRRAFFLLKEIVSVRQKVTPTDIAIVDRKKTNLTSNIDYWNNNNNGFYSVKTEETNTKPSNVREFLKEFEPKSQLGTKPYVRVDTTKYRPKVINNTYIAVDIKPEDSEDVQNEVFEEVEFLCDGDMDINDDDIGGNDTADENVADNKEVEDVFIRLPEEKCEEDSDYGLPELLVPKPKRSKKRVKGDTNFPELVLKKVASNNKQHTNTNKVVCGMESKKALKFSRALVDFNIQVISFEEQKDTFVARKEMEPYKSAGFKCAMCLIVYPGMSELMKHVQVHNMKQKKLTQEQRKKFLCAICKDTFGCQTELTAHSACYHWYKYCCKICQKEKYSLIDTLNCHKLPMVSVSKFYTMDELFIMSDMTSQEKLAPMEANCRLCGWPVDGKRALEDHQMSHVLAWKESDTLPRFQCDLCGLWSRLKAHLVSHMATHYRTFTCRECCEVFEGWNAANDHLKVHQIVRCFACDCDQTFRSDRELLEHKATHSKDAKIDCSLCGHPTYSLSKMYYHQLVTHGYISINHLSVSDSKYKCGMCGEEFVDEVSLKMHKLEQGHVEADRIGGKCGSCKKIFFTTGEFIAHRRGNTVCRKYPVKCVYCEEILKHFYMSRRHYAEAHPGQTNEHENVLVSICELCGKSIAPANMRKHKLRHTMPSTVPSLKCRLCNHRMYSSRVYVSHMLFNHTPKPYMCAQCPYRTTHRSDCRDHILKVHAPELLYSCQKCSRKFSHLDLLERHSIRAHGSSDDRNVYPPLKDVAGKVAVFPHMKIDGSLIPPAVIDDAGLYLYDFLCKAHRRVDWRDYYVFNTGVQPTDPDPNLHRKYPQKKPLDYKRRDRSRKPIINEAVIKAIENQMFPSKTKVKEEIGEKRKCVGDSGGSEVKVKIAKFDVDYSHSDLYADVDNVEREETILGYDTPEPSKGKLKSSQKRSNIKERRKITKPVGDVLIKAIESQSVDSGKVKVMDLYEASNDADVSVDNIEHEETVQGCDMPDLNADILVDTSQGHEAEVIIEEGTNEIKFVEEECEELDMSQLLDENYEIIEENGEKYVLLNGNLYKLQFETS